MNYISLKRKLKFQQAICISISITVALIIYFAFKIQDGYWIPMTVSIVFALPTQGDIERRGVDRILGTFFGLFLGFFYLNLFMYYDYCWVYFLPLVWFAFFYIQYTTNNYCMTVIVITMFIPIVFSVLAIESFQLYSTLISRFFCTMIGCFIALIAERIIYRHAARQTVDFRYYFESIFINISYTLDSVCTLFLNNSIKRSDAIIDLRTTMDSFLSIEKIYYGSTIQDAQQFGNFDDVPIINSLKKEIAHRTLSGEQILHEEAIQLWTDFSHSDSNIHY